MVGEVIDYLDLSPGKVIVDATIGTGGHSREIIERIMPGGRLIGIDRDEDSLTVARERLRDFGSACEFVYGNFVDMDEIMKNLNIKKIDGILFDLGLSTYQLEDSDRGFSFQSEGPLDMRFDRKSFISAYDLINNLNEDEISAMLWTFGQERWHNRIAHFLVEERQKHSIDTTRELSDIVVRAIPHKYRHYHIHPATRTFQAVRIAVNRELETIEAGISKAIELLDRAGRICVISFHSLEDRIAKFSFRKFSASGQVRIITPKPLTPKEDEVRENRASRSSKLRVAEKL
ncbi:16S rRNA (cytosine(1402)-N(4))-methyltransferase RsmH [Patescibacteria group bacterium]|nr:16S rRNA (cytosine(1402)-N(4))-methyltransferase RsmH [Patescibacteria group bacterium]